MKTNIPPHTVGIDLGDKKHHICVLDAAGSQLESRPMANNKEAFARLSRKYPEARIVMEVGAQSPWISRAFDALGHEVLVANARKLRAIYQDDRKSDEADAEILARMGRFDPKLLHPIHHGSEQSQRHLIVVKQRDNLVRRRANMICSLRFTVKSLGIRLRSPNSACFAKACRLAMKQEHSLLLDEIECVLEVIDVISAKIRELDKRLEEICEEHYPDTRRLRQIVGVGPVTALTYVLVIDDTGRFANSRAVGAYLGLCPRRDQSGDTDKELRISKAGNAYLRKLLVSAAQYIIGPFGQDCDLRRHGLELASRGGQKAKKKAVVAVARKLAVLMHHLWSRKADYQASYNNHSQAA
ncbi:IS110 family transposase ISCARN52 [Rubritalea halochordaticola]|uniref:IS110 family transposase ISCARN52 n=1 Tax=Rubritalea halochordaticola TaxID=714537 RepID=A0ABP9V6E9_9BACT